MKIGVVFGRSIVQSQKVQDIPNMRKYSLWRNLYNVTMVLGRTIKAGVSIAFMKVGHIIIGRWVSDDRDNTINTWLDDDRG